MDLKTLERMTVLKLRDEASKIPDLTGLRGMSKEELTRAIARAHNIDLSGRRRGGTGKSDVKKQIRALRAEIKAAIQKKDKSDLKRLRRRVKRLKAETRRLAKVKAPAETPAAGALAAPPSA